jgi:hypothetical protein
MEQTQLLTPAKLQLNNIQFKSENVLYSAHDKYELREKLISAMKLGNNHKQKVRIQFLNDVDKQLEIKAKVWSVTEKYVILRNSIMIPISAITDVNFI